MSELSNTRSHHSATMSITMIMLMYPSTAGTRYYHATLIPSINQKGARGLRTAGKRIDKSSPDIRWNTRRLAKGHILLAVLSFVTATACFTPVSRNDITIQLHPDYGNLGSHF